MRRRPFALLQANDEFGNGQFTWTICLFRGKASRKAYAVIYGMRTYKSKGSAIAAGKKDIAYKLGCSFRFTKEEQERFDRIEKKARRA